MSYFINCFNQKYYFLILLLLGFFICIFFYLNLIFNKALFQILFGLFLTIYLVSLIIFCLKLSESESESGNGNGNDSAKKNLIIKINKKEELDNNFDNLCIICLESVLIGEDSYKLYSCNFHIYHHNCLKQYIKNKFDKCPICNV